MAGLFAGFFAPWLISTLILLVHLILPARRVRGYVHDENTGELLRYRLNGPLVLVAIAGLWFGAGYSRLLPWDWLYTHRWPSLAGSCVLGLIISAAAVLLFKGHGGRERSFRADFYPGRALNISIFRGRVDVKMYLYLVGAVMLGLNILAFTAHHLLLFGMPSSAGVLVYAGLFFWFIADYLVFERVHLYTYDIFAERVGFKLIWGCFAFYPYFYLVGLWAASGVAGSPMPLWHAVTAVCIFIAGWILSRGANMQKYYFKTMPDRAFLGIIQPHALLGNGHALLYSGFWRVARHVNYLGEFLMATGLTLALGIPGPLVAWLYPLYYIVLLVPRERADERRCSAKYGDLWKEYVRRVPRRIIPGLY